MDDTRSHELVERLEQARHALSEAERENAAATLAHRAPPFSSEQVRELEYAVADIAEEVYGGHPFAVGPGARRMIFPAAG